jgi:hypothetical protein
VAGERDIAFAAEDDVDVDFSATVERAQTLRIGLTPPSGARPVPPRPDADLAGRRRCPVRTRSRIGSVRSQTLTFIPARTRSPLTQNARNCGALPSRTVGSPRKTTWS